MLKRVAIIDECDILGQKLDPGNAIHKVYRGFSVNLDVRYVSRSNQFSQALVPVYKDLLNFYIAAQKILTSKTFVLALVCEQLRQRLPTIVTRFCEHAEVLKYRIDNATLELVADIKKLLQDNMSKLSVGQRSRCRN